MTAQNEDRYRIGQVSKMLGIPSYVLRFWETEFPELKPRKTETGQRYYTGSDIEVLRRIAQLRYDEKLTLSGAKQKLNMPESPDGARDQLKQTLHFIKNSLQEILAALR